MPDNEKMSELYRKYRDNSHAIQTGVAYEHANGSNDGSPKHLRVGINMRAVDHAALIKLLIAKGILTEEEYAVALVDESSQEVRRYEERLTEHYKTPITLG